MTKAAPHLAGQLAQRLGLRYAPQVRFYLDNSIGKLEDLQRQASSYLEVVRQERQAAERGEKGELTGYFAHLAKPLLETKAQIDMMKQLSQQQKLELLSKTEDPKQQLVLKAMMDDNQLRILETGTDEQLAALRQQQHETRESIRKNEEANRHTRRGKRVTKQFDAWKHKLEEAS